MSFDSGDTCAYVVTMRRPAMCGGGLILQKVNECKASRSVSGSCFS